MSSVVSVAKVTGEPKDTEDPLIVPTNAIPSSPEPE